MRGELGHSPASAARAPLPWLSGYRSLYVAVGAFAIFMVAVVVQANDYWLSFLARDGSRRFPAESNFQMDASFGRTPVGLAHVDVVSIGVSECGYALQIRHSVERPFVVVTRCLEAD